MNRRQRETLLMIGIVAVGSVVFYQIMKMIKDKKSIPSVQGKIETKKPSFWQRLKQSFIKDIKGNKTIKINK